MPLAGGHKGARSWLRGRVVLEVIALHPSHTSRDLTQFHPLQPFAAQTYSRIALDPPAAAPLPGTAVAVHQGRGQALGCRFRDLKKQGLR